MPGFYKFNLDNKFHATSWFYRLLADAKWHPFRNMFHKVANDSKWHPVWLYEWMMSAWGPCTVNCGGGTQTRTVYCKRSDGLLVHDSFCDNVTKPVTQQVCNTQSCGVTVQIASSCDDQGEMYYCDSSWNTIQAFGWKWGDYGQLAPGRRTVTFNIDEPHYFKWSHRNNSSGAKGSSVNLVVTSGTLNFANCQVQVVQNDFGGALSQGVNRLSLGRRYSHGQVTTRMIVTLLRV